MLETIKINGTEIIFDKEKTELHLTDYNKPCECQNCRNFYENINRNKELITFLEKFGVYHNYTDEVFSWDYIETLIHSEAYYGVYGVINGEDFSFEKYGVTITFTSQPQIPFNHDRYGDYFWIVIEADFSWVLDESQEIEKLSRKEIFIDIIKAIFKR